MEVAGYPCLAMPCDGTCKLEDRTLRTHNRTGGAMGDTGYGSLAGNNARVTSSHTYTFSIYGVPTVEQLQEELDKAKQAVGPGARVRIKTSSDQRDGDHLSATVTEGGGR